VTAASMETSIRNQIEDKQLNYDGGYSHCGVYVYGGYYVNGGYYADE
jgi:hypothetical protein